MPYRWSPIHRPGGYHGAGRSGPFFEGWYLKLVSADRMHRWAFIPGIVLGKDAHAFVQVLDGRTGQMHYNRFPTTWAESAHFEVQIGPNRFSREGLDVDLQGPGGPVRGRVDFGTLKPWPVRLLAPGAMGPFAFTPRLECLHGVLSMDHTLSGTLRLKNETVRFDGGRGYLEKDWGRSFPEGYVWAQSNHFGGAEGTSLSLSVARVPYGPLSFKGVLAGLWHDGRLHRLTTYTGTALQSLKTDGPHARIVLGGPGRRLEVLAQRGSRRASLVAPTRAGMTGRVAESMDAHLHVRFRARGRTVFEGTTDVAAQELQNLESARLLI